MELSAKNGWQDDLSRIYIICTLEEIREMLSCSQPKAVKMLKELEEDCRLIERKRVGLNQPNRIYVKDFVKKNYRLSMAGECFDYFYAGEEERYTFYRIPKVLISRKEFQKISTDAKLLYGIILDRTALSV